MALPNEQYTEVTTETNGHADELNLRFNELLENEQYLEENKLSAADVDGVPSGAIMMWSGDIEEIPEGWSLCNGENETPDLTDRFIVGAGNNYSVGNIGGAEEVTLTESELPSHNHSMQTTGSHNHTYELRSTTTHELNDDPDIESTSYPIVNYEVIEEYDTSLAGSHSHSIYSSGGDSSHENRPPYYALAFIMKE